MTITYCNTYKVLQLNPSNSESMCKTTLTELLQEVLDGNAPRATFEKAFCETYYEFVYLTARKFVNSNQDAEDVAQDVFIKKILRLELGKFPEILSGNPEGWLYTTVRNYCYDYHRLNGKWNQLEDIETITDISQLVDEPSIKNLSLIHI